MVNVADIRQVENNKRYIQMIRKEGNKYILYTRDGTRKLGTHDSMNSAIKQEHAIQVGKNPKKRTVKK